MNTSRKLKQLHGLEFFEKLFSSNEEFHKYISNTIIEAENNGYRFDRETVSLVITETYFDEFTGEVIYEEYWKNLHTLIKSDLTRELKNSRNFISRKLNSLPTRENKQVYLEQVFNLLSYFTKKAKHNRFFKTLEAKDEAFLNLALELHEKYPGFCNLALINELIKSSASTTTQITLPNPLAEEMGEARWKTYEKFFNLLISKKRNLKDLARHIRVELPEKGYLDVSPSAERTTEILRSITGRIINTTTSIEKHLAGNEIKLDPPLPSIKDRK